MENESPIEKVSAWIKNSIMLKLITITILMLLLLIPASMIKGIISERQLLNDQATHEVSAKWAERQEITGPILSIPIIYTYRGKDGITYEETKYWHTLPKNLTIDGTIDPERLKRGIYEVVVYASQLDFKGDFQLEAPDQLHIKEIQYAKAFLTLGVSDLRGIKNQIKIQWNDTQLDVKPGSKVPDLIATGITVELPETLDSSESLRAFTFHLNLQGSQNLSFVPVGSQTNIQLSSSWNSPSFNGNFLPDNRSLTDEGFTANWTVLQLNRNYPQTWVGESNTKSLDLARSAFGVDLILPLDDYQKSMRSAKYAIMTISLTFLVFFLVEILNKRKIHPFQYALVGLALCLFYVLLVSITEHTNFNFAYGVSTIGIVTMISLYSLSVFKMSRLTYLLVFILIGIYSFLFVTLQLADYALLMGSIGLTVMLGLTMYFTRKINWYKLNIELA